MSCDFLRGEILPKVSVITVCLNSEATIRQTIESVLGQDYPNMEYIIIDGGSTDATLSIIDEYRESIAIFISERDQGVYDAMNKGLEQVSGDLIGILNSDDWYEQGAIRKVTEAFSRTACDIVYGDIYFCDEEKRNRNKELPLDTMWYQMAVSHPAVFVARDMYKKYGKFDEQYHLASDYDLMLRFYISGAKFVHIPEILTYYRMGGLSFQKHYISGIETVKIAMKYRKYAPDKVIVRRKCMERLYDDSITFTPCEAAASIKKLLTGRAGKDTKTVFWGAGYQGARLLAVLKQYGVPVEFIVDCDLAKQGRAIEGIRIYSPKLLADFVGVVFITVLNHNAEILSQLKRIGISEDRIITLEDCMSLIMDNVLYEGNK